MKNERTAFLFGSELCRKIVVTNMTRPEKGKVCENAGVLTYKFVKKNMGHRLTSVLFYIGYV